MRVSEINETIPIMYKFNLIKSLPKILNAKVLKVFNSRFINNHENILHSPYEIKVCSCGEDYILENGSSVSNSLGMMIEHLRIKHHDEFKEILDLNCSTRFNDSEAYSAKYNIWEYILSEDLYSEQSN